MTGTEVTAQENLLTLAPVVAAAAVAAVLSYWLFVFAL